MKFDRVHRLGNDTAKKPRPIVAKFHYFKEREVVRQKGYEASETLKRDNYGIGIQWPYKVREARKELYPVMKRLKDNGHHNVKMVRDKLYVNGRPYNDPRATPQSRQYFPINAPPQYQQHLAPMDTTNFGENHNIHNNNPQANIWGGQEDHLSVIAWNVFGLKRKLCDPEFLNFVSNNDLLFLSET